MADRADHGLGNVSLGEVFGGGSLMHVQLDCKCKVCAWVYHASKIMMEFHLH